MHLRAAHHWDRVLAYTLMALAGVAAIAWPTPSVRAISTGVLVYVWAVMLTVGGISCAIGAALDRWLGEYAGLWPLIVTFAVYALAAATAGRATAIAGAFALGSIAMFLFARWREVALIRREAARYNAEREER